MCQKPPQPKKKEVFNEVYEQNMGEMVAAQLRILF